jgi:hypothetical protein
MHDFLAEAPVQSLPVLIPVCIASDCAGFQSHLNDNVGIGGRIARQVGGLYAAAIARDAGHGEVYCPPNYANGMILGIQP